MIIWLLKPHQNGRWIRHHVIVVYTLCTFQGFDSTGSRNLSILVLFLLAACHGEIDVTLNDWVIQQILEIALLYFRISVGGNWSVDSHLGVLLELEDWLVSEKINCFHLLLHGLLSELLHGTEVRCVLSYKLLLLVAVVACEQASAWFAWLCV